MDIGILGLPSLSLAKISPRLSSSLGEATTVCRPRVSSHDYSPSHAPVNTKPSQTKASSVAQNLPIALHVLEQRT